MRNSQQQRAAANGGAPLAAAARCDRPFVAASVGGRASQQQQAAPWHATWRGQRSLCSGKRRRSAVAGGSAQRTSAVRNGRQWRAAVSGEVQLLGRSPRRLAAPHCRTQRQVAAHDVVCKRRAAVSGGALRPADTAAVGGNERWHATASGDERRCAGVGSSDARRNNGRRRATVSGDYGQRVAASDGVRMCASAIGGERCSRRSAPVAGGVWRLAVLGCS